MLKFYKKLEIVSWDTSCVGCMSIFSFQIRMFDHNIDWISKGKTVFNFNFNEEVVHCEKNTFAGMRQVKESITDTHYAMKFLIALLSFVCWKETSLPMPPTTITWSFKDDKREYSADIVVNNAIPHITFVKFWYCTSCCGSRIRRLKHQLTVIFLPTHKPNTTVIWLP